jgi:hypothetical protein
MEKMIGARLNWYLETQNLSPAPSRLQEILLNKSTNCDA